MELRAPPMSSSRPMKAVVVWIIVAQALATTLLAGLLWWRTSGNGAGDSPAVREAARTRQVASKLKAAGALDEAAGLYATYLDGMGAGEEGRAAVAYSLGSLYLEAGQYEKALRWLYEADAALVGHDDRALAEQIGPRIVHVLERLGRTQAAQAALSSRVALGQRDADSSGDSHGTGGGKAAHADSDPVVARVGTDEIRQSDVLRALDDLPPEVAKHFGGEERREQFLRRYVADELLWRRAQKLEYDRDPEIRRRSELMRRQLVIGKFIDKEVLGKIEVSEADLQSYFTANKARYDQPEGARVRLIKVASEAKASEVFQRISKGASFADVASTESLDAASKGSGGLLDRWVGRGEDWLGTGESTGAAPNSQQGGPGSGGSAAASVAASNAVFEASKGQVTKPVKAGDYFYIFKIEDRRPKKSVTITEVRRQVEQDYRLMKTQAAYSGLVDQELNAAGVQLFPEKLEQVN